MNFRMSLLAIISLFALDISAAMVSGFPEGCSDASTSNALPGHIVRLGMVRQGPDGLIFVFPDRYDTRYLQTVEVAENVGLIGQDPYGDYSDVIRYSTPEDSFVVAQIFVGDERYEPVVSCVSQPIPLTRYYPSDYGSDWSWLDRGVFVERLRHHRHHRSWRWKKWWRRDFDSVRRKFRRSNSQRDFRRFRQHNRRTFGDRRHSDSNRRSFRRGDGDDSIKSSRTRSFKEGSSRVQKNLQKSPFYL